MATPIHWPKCSAAQFAELMGVAKQSVTQWIDAGMPCARGRGKGHLVTVTLEQAMPWVLARREPAGSQRERLAKEQADKVAIDNAAKRGEVVFLPMVSDVLNEMAATLAGQLDALPGRVASELAGLTDPGQIRGRLLDETRGIRGAIADAGAKLAESGRRARDDGGDSEAAAEADGERVGRRKPRAPVRKRRARAVAKR
jgi:phage terminase Nu1 subunit (DNA packaging protein)